MRPSTSSSRPSEPSTTFALACSAPGVRMVVEDMCVRRIAASGAHSSPYHQTFMARRATKRGDQRTPLHRDCDVLICGASFAGLAVARELAGSGADVLVIDRYEIGERATSACGIPTPWLEALELQAALQQTFGELVIHTPFRAMRYRLPWTFSTFDYRT